MLLYFLGYGVILFDLFIKFKLFRNLNTLKKFKNIKKELISDYMLKLYKNSIIDYFCIILLAKCSSIFSIFIISLILFSISLFISVKFCFIYKEIRNNEEFMEIYIKEVEFEMKTLLNEIIKEDIVNNYPYDFSHIKSLINTDIEKCNTLSELNDLQSKIELLIEDYNDKIEEYKAYN